MGYLLLRGVSNIAKCRHLSTSRSTSKEIRQYFYHLDTRGQVFLEDTKHKNFVTSLKDKQFLNQLFRQLRRTPEEDIQRTHYPVVSVCMGERNYIHIDDTRAHVVFSTLKTG